MKTSKIKQQKVIVMFQNGSKIQYIADDQKLARNTVKNILRRNHLLPYSYAKSPQNGPPSPFDPTFSKNNEQPINQLNDSLGASLISELDKKNKEIEELTQQVKKYQTQNESMMQEIEKIKKTVNEYKAQAETMNQDQQKNFNDCKDFFNEQLKINKQDYEEELELRKQADKRELARKEEDYQRNLEKQKNNYDKQIKTIKENHKIELEQKDNIITVKEKKIEEDQETIKNTVSKAMERIKSLHKEILALKKEENVSYRDGFICGLLLGGTGGALGTLFIQKLLSPPINTTQPNVVYPRKARPVINAFPIPPETMTQSDIDYNNSGINPVANISGTICSGPFNSNYGETYNAGCDTTINQQDAEIIDNPQPSNQYNLSTYTSNNQCLGTFLGNNNEIGSTQSTPEKNPNNQTTSLILTTKNTDIVPIQYPIPIPEPYPPITSIYLTPINPPNNIKDSQ